MCAVTADGGRGVCRRGDYTPASETRDTHITGDEGGEVGRKEGQGGKKEGMKGGGREERIRKMRGKGGRGKEMGGGKRLIFTFLYLTL